MLPSHETVVIKGEDYFEEHEIAIEEGPAINAIKQLQKALEVDPSAYLDRRQERWDGPDEWHLRLIMLTKLDLNLDRHFTKINSANVAIAKRMEQEAKFRDQQIQNAKALLASLEKDTKNDILKHTHTDSGIVQFNGDHHSSGVTHSH